MLRISQEKNIQRNAGFTLIELMVSIAIFAIVMTISTGTLLVLIDLNAKAQAVYSATSNISFALDSMSREIRTGYRYYCSDTDPGSTLPSEDTDGDSDCAGGDVIVFTRERDNVRVGYKLNTTTERIERQEGVVGTWMPITAEEITISEFDITVADSETYYDSANNTNQPKIDVLIRGYINNGLDTDTDFNIQTRMVERRLDVI